MNWNKLSKNKPIAVETGCWDGFRNNELLVRTLTGRKYVAHMYMGNLDGNDFMDFYEVNTSQEISNVTHWLEIDEP